MQRLEIGLLDRFDGDKLHGGAQHGFGDRFRGTSRTVCHSPEA
jgi:hypothetical protein